MKLKWLPNETFTQELISSWTLSLIGSRGTTQLRLGTLYQVDTGYVLMERGGKQALTLGNDLSLDEAQRAAKLLLCVGERA